MNGVSSLKSLPFDRVLALTEREYEVFLLLGEGLTVHEICMSLPNRVGHKCVESHIANMKAKLNLDYFPLRAYATRYLVHREQTGIERSRVDRTRSNNFEFKQQTVAA